MFNYPFTTHIVPGWDGAEWSGAACLASVVLSEWPEGAPTEVVYRLAREHNAPRSTQSPAHLLEVAGREGFMGEQWDEWGECEGGLNTGRAILALVRNRFPCPKHYPPHIDDDALHWIRILGLWSTAMLCIVHDPLTHIPQEHGFVYRGPVLYTAWSVRWGALGNTHPTMGISLQSPSGRNLNNG